MNGPSKRSLNLFFISSSLEYPLSVFFFPSFSMHKLLLAPVLASAMLFVACNPTPTQTPPAETSSSAPAMMEDSSAADTTTPPAEARVINMTAENWAFSPNAITAKVGEKVTVHLTGASGIHSFASKDLGINVPIQTGETKDVVIPTDKPGTYSFRCAVPCGSGHRDMTGTIVIE